MALCVWLLVCWFAVFLTHPRGAPSVRFSHFLVCVEQVGGQVLAPLWKTPFFFFLSRRGGRVAKFHFATPTLSCFFLTNGLKIKFWNNYRAGRPGWGRAGLGPGPGARVPERLSGSRAFRRAARLRKECQGAECLSGSGPPNSVSL